jgi:pyrroloquinoline quinone biosynthesis protein D
MINPTARPCLCRKVRLRFDRRTSRYLLLFPEMGLDLNGTAAEIARLCTGKWTVDDMALHLAQTYADGSPLEIRRDLYGFLQSLAGRGLLQGLQ